jgi:uncharacterized protein (DUF1697 family)
VPTHAAFLRALNVGGRRVDMATLRSAVESFGAVDVATVLASGNVVLTPPEGDDDLEHALAAHLEQVLGWPVPTMIRTAAEVAAILGREPFGGAERTGGTHHVGLLSAAPAPSAVRAVAGLSTDDDLLVVEGRELHWLRRGPMMEASFAPADLERALSGVALTLRTAGTIEKVARKLG